MGDEDEEGAVEEEKEEEEKKPKTKKVDKTWGDWELCNQSKPIWTRKPEQIEEGEYEEFYKAITKDKNGPMTQTHFIAEGEVTQVFVVCAKQARERAVQQVRSSPGEHQALREESFHHRRLQGYDAQLSQLCERCGGL